MRLHRLAVTAFGPFGATQEIDFDALSSAGLFLLHGPTGAGKTSVLDAVCYALYGAVPGARQSPGASLRSDHAPAGTSTEVTLELTVGERRLEITRRPAQPRPKKRGGGFTTEKAQSWLREYDAGSGEWAGLSRSHQEIGEEITQLLGMSREQFCQVVLLPQGDFARFLRADAEARGKLLGRLFDTRRFAAVEERLADLRRAAEQQVRDGDERLLALSHRIAQVTGGAVVEERPGEPGLAEAVQTRAAVARSEAREALDIADSAVSAAEARQAAARLALDAERDLATRQARYADARRRQEELEGRRPERDAWEAELDRARKADRVAPALALRADAEREHAAASAARQQSRGRLPADLADAGAEQLSALEHRLREELGGLESARRAERRGAEIARERAVLERQARADEEILQEAGGWLTGWETRRAELTARIESAQEAAARAEHLAGRLEPARRRLSAARRRDDLAERTSTAESRLTTARERRNAAHEAWLDVKSRRLRGIAAELAAALTPGAPCQVCGSADHPAPARTGADHVDRTAEDAAYAAFTAAEEARTAAERELAATTEAWSAARAEVLPRLADGTDATPGARVPGPRDAATAPATRSGAPAGEDGEWAVSGAAGAVGGLSAARGAASAQARALADPVAGATAPAGGGPDNRDAARRGAPADAVTDDRTPADHGPGGALPAAGEGVPADGGVPGPAAGGALPAAGEGVPADGGVPGSAAGGALPAAGEGGLAGDGAPAAAAGGASVPEGPDGAVEPTVAELAREVEELARQHAEAHALAAQTHSAREALARAEREYERRVGAQRDAERRVAGRTSQREALDREQAALDAELVRGRGESGSVAEHATRLERKIAILVDAAETVRAVDLTAQRLKEADDRLADAAFRAGFATPAQAAAALLEDGERRALQRRLDAWQAEAAAVADRLAEPETRAAADRPPADPASAEAAHTAAERALRDATSALAAVRDRCAELSRLSRQADTEVRRLGPLRVEYERVARLAGLTAGTSAENERKMRLESYVLAARLEQVAAAATARLQRMSSGRYTLVHSDARSGGRRAGLGLHVVDAWTGNERDTATLSGGETFFASLALALGLADVVTDEAGGVRLDTLFIDEGFGSLDDQTLDEVLDVLDSLRERDRSVGIVSHVGDLRRRIPAQLEVVKERHGSAVRLRTGGILSG
ncbi:AAA family ATPase [Streptomyces sp. NPDC002992]|uniref:AAA family ATPase n=1 Tax=Streptomyces sp. NPDC002992 TaxID=3154273 RepID=UPI0033AE53BC